MKMVVVGCTAQEAWCMAKKHDPVNYPSHYIWRHEHKGKPIEDLDKAIWFLNKLKEQYE